MAEATDEEIASAAGFTVAFFRSNDELWGIFKDARKEEWGGDRLSRAIRNSDWFASNAESVRQLDLLQASDPSEAGARLDKAHSEVLRISRDTGLGWGIQDGKLKATARLALMNNWTEEQIRQHLAGLGSIQERMRKDKPLTGDAGAAQNLVRQLSADYGVNISEGKMRTMVSNIAAGQWDENYARNYFIDKSKSLYRNIADEIDAGMTVREVAEPYIDSMSRLLEMNPNSIDVFDNDIRRAITSGEDGPMDLMDFETRVRQDERWNRTNNARESMMGVGRELLTQMGVVG